MQFEDEYYKEKWNKCYQTDLNDHGLTPWLEIVIKNGY
jgi:hypothetical protein